MSEPDRFIADTGPLLCHGALPKGARRMRSALGEFRHVGAVRKELERHVSAGSRRHLEIAAGGWVGRHLGMLGDAYPMTGIESSVQEAHDRLARLDQLEGKTGRPANANLGEAEAIAAAAAWGAALIANDRGARTVATERGVAIVITTIDVLKREVATSAVTAEGAFDDYVLMRDHGFDPGDHPKGPLDLGD